MVNFDVIKMYEIIDRYIEWVKEIRNRKNEPNKKKKNVRKK